MRPWALSRKVVVAFSGCQRLDGVGDHAIKPASRVRAGDKQEGSINGREGRGGEQSVELAGKLGGLHGHRRLIVSGGWRMQGVSLANPSG